MPTSSFWDTPNIIAEFSAAFSLLSACISGMIFVLNRETLKRYDAELQNLAETLNVNRRVLINSAHADLQKTIQYINDRFLDLDIDFHVLKDVHVDKDHEQETKKSVVLLLHQINLLYQAFLYQEAIGSDVVSSYKNWADQTVKPWVKRDKALSGILRNIRSGSDLYHPDFIKWIREIFSDV